MSFEFEIGKQTVEVNGFSFTKDHFLGVNPPEFFHTKELKELYSFLREWFDEKDFVWVKTSGSTGTPKPFKASKQRMMNSAQMTCSYLNLKKGDTALLCMKLDYIAGKMVVVRSLIAGLHLFVVPVTGNPLQDVPKEQTVDFAALIPLQVYNSLQKSDEKKKLKGVRNLIVGGGVVDQKITEQLQAFPNTIYSTYGMTETLSHVALRCLNGKLADEYYTPLQGVTLSLSDKETLVIEAPAVSAEKLETNDVVELRSNGQFRVLGRIDNIINSGGIKIQIEEVERILYPFWGTRFAITSLPDSKFGEIVVLVVTESLDLALLELLPAYYRPKRIIQIVQIPLSETGKVQRSVLKQLVIKLSNV